MPTFPAIGFEAYRAITISAFGSTQTACPEELQNTLPVIEARMEPR
jgi:hypothetical protein